MKTDILERMVRWRRPTVLGRCSVLLGTLLIGLVAPLAHAALDVSGTTVSSPARQGDSLSIEWTVSNSDSFARSDVVMTMEFPAGVNQLFDSSFSGDCPSTACETGETVTWTLGTIAANSALSFRFAPVVAGASADGSVISFVPTVTDATTDMASTTLDVGVDGSGLYQLDLAETRDPATAGSELTYRIAFGYLQDVVAVTNSTLRFNVPANATFVSASNGGTNAAGVVSWPLGFLSPGQGGEREVTILLNGGLTAGEQVRASAEIFSVAAPSTNSTVAADTTIAATSGLQIAVEANPDPARPGELMNIDVTVVNTDPFTRFGVGMSARWPQELAQTFDSSFDGDCPSTACETGEQVTFTLGDIPAGGSVTARLAPLMSTVAQSGSVMTLGFTAADASGLQTRQSDSVLVDANSQFELALAEDTDPAVAGATIRYTLDYALRADAGTVANSVLSLPLPAGTTFVSASDGGSASNGVVTWALGVLSPGQSGVRNATLQIAPGLAPATVIAATAQLTTAAASLDVALAEAHTVIATAGGLQLAVESNVNPARTSELTNLQLVVRNTDPFPRFGVTLVGRFPQGFAQLFDSGFAGDCPSTACESGEEVVWSLGDIGAGDTAVVDLPAVIPSTAADGTLASFYLAARDSLGFETRQMETIRVDSDTIYDLLLAEDADPATSGSALNYTLHWGFRSDAASVAQTVLRLPVPEGTTFVSASDGGTLVGDTVQWALGFLSPGDNGLREAAFTVNAGVSAGSVIDAAADITKAGDTIDRLRAEALTSVTAGSGLKMTIETNINAARLNEKSNYRLMVSNTDPFTRFGVQVRGRFPQDILQLFESLFDGACPSTACESGEIVAWTLGDIAPGDAKFVDLPGVMTSVGVDGLLANFFVTAQDDQGDQVRLVDTLRLQSDTVYDVALNESSDPAVPGATFDYTATWGLREDASSVRNTRLQLTLPAGVTLQSASGGFVQVGNVVTWDLGFVSPGDAGARSATVMIDGGVLPGNTLEASADLFDVAATDERVRSEAHTAVRSTVPLSLDVDGVVFTAIENRSINTRLTVTNNDPFTRFGVALRARFPRDVAQLFESVAGFDGNCASTACEPDEIVSWPLVDIPAGESVTVTFPPNTAANVVEGSLINLYAWVEDDQGVQARGSQAYSVGCIEDLDTDCDAILDTQDNCLGVINTLQRDTDGDGIGNACDADIDPSGNCVVNVVDLGILRAAFFATPTSDNWNPDADFNGDGVVNVIDLGTLRAGFFQPPGPSALPNACAP